MLKLRGTGESKVLIVLKDEFLEFLDLYPEIGLHSESSFWSDGYSSKSKTIRDSGVEGESDI